MVEMSTAALAITAQSGINGTRPSSPSDAIPSEKMNLWIPAPILEYVLPEMV